MFVLQHLSSCIAFFTNFPCLIRSSPADFNQAKQTLESLPPQNSKLLATAVWKFCQFWKSSRFADAADVKIQPKPRYYLLKVQHFCNLSLVSLTLYPRPLRGAERTRQGEGRWSLPPKTALERSDLTEKFQLRESHTEAKTNKTPE